MIDIKGTPVRILLPDRSMWIEDTAREVKIAGMTNELGKMEKILKLSNAKQLIPKFQPQRIKAGRGLREEYVLYTPDFINYYPLSTEFKLGDFKIHPEDYNHPYLRGLLMSQAQMKFKRDKWWQTYMPLVFITVLIIASAVYQAAAISEQKEIASILAGQRPAESTGAIMGAVTGGLQGPGSPG